MLVRLLRPLRKHIRLRQQQLMSVKIDGAQVIQEALTATDGVLITPNHASHADPAAMYETADRLGRPFFFMATWHVFASKRWLTQRVLQWHGVFSVDREGTDLKAFKQAVRILQQEPYPLVIFPEGEIYHCNDRVTPFREGPAAIALSAGRRSQRPIQCVPCAVKYRYIEDPTNALVALMSRLEQHIHWRPRTTQVLAKRIYDFGQAMMSLKEMEYLGQAIYTLRQRIDGLARHILDHLELRDDTATSQACVPDRVKTLRHRILSRLADLDADHRQSERLNDNLDDLFLVVQLFSYPGDYVAERPTTERMAETLDKFEEDVLGRYSATIRAPRRVIVRFGEPITIGKGRRQQITAGKLTEQLEGRVQQLLDGIDD